MVYPASSMQPEGGRELGNLEAQLASKEREWKELQALRVHELKSSLKKAKEECLSLRNHYQQLREAFQFNLAILDERDRELERYDVVTDRALTLEHNRQEELSRLRIQVAMLEERRAREAEERQEELSINATQHRLQLDKLRSEIKKQTEEHERMKWDLQRRVQEVEGELTLQRQEMTAAFDSELRQQEHEFKMKMDEMCAVVLSHDLKMKLLSKEAEVHCQAQFQATEALKTSKEFCQQIQTQLQHKDRVIKDITAVKNHRIKELEEKVEWMETKLKKEEDEHMKKYEDVVRSLKECEGQLEVQQQVHTQQLQRAEKHIVKLQEDMEVLSAQAHCVHKDQQEAMEQKDETIQRLRTEVETTRAGWDKYISQASSEMVTKDTKMFTLQEREAQLRTELERSREEVERYKQQLSTSLKRERDLEQSGVQVELEWQRRCEELKSAHYLTNEQLMQDLMQARDQVLTPKVDSLASEHIHRLQEQNNVLRAVVTHMRKDMEGLCHLLPHPDEKLQASSPQPVQPPAAPATTSIAPTADTQIATGPPAQSTDISSKFSKADYTQALEQEVSQLKTRCRQLEGQLEGATGLSSLAQGRDKPAEDLAPIIPDKTHSQNQGLKQGGLCVEKCANAALKKQEVRAAHIEPDPANIMEQNVLVQQLQEANLYLWQQQQQLALRLMSSGLFENVQGSRRDPPPLHTRLKQAASYIARLSREKQQLIEMGNCLRAQISTAGLQGTITEPMEPQRDSSTEKQGHQHERLSAPEPQHQLTTQSSKNKENASPISQSQSSLDVRLQPHSPLSRSQLPSEESPQTLKELWEILDRGLSSSIYSEGEDKRSSGEVAELGVSGAQMTVYGICAPIRSNPPDEVQQRRNPSKIPSNTTKTSKPGAASRINRIRNYNVKD
ncbi:hypothetical protein PAMA_012875 [Pampus argenteus]